MPIITFLQEFFSLAKGPYHCKIGRHTQRFCSKAATRSTNEIQRKIFLVTAICADECIAALIGVDNKREVEGFKGRIVKQKLTKQQITVALRVYMSAILILISCQKELLLQKANLQEQQLLNTWCAIFEYSSSDMQLFNEVLLPAYQQSGANGLSVLVGKIILEQLFIGNDVLSLSEMEILQNKMARDVTAVVRPLQIDKMEAL